MSLWLWPWNCVNVIRTCHENCVHYSLVEIIFTQSLKNLAYIFQREKPMSQFCNRWTHSSTNKQTSQKNNPNRQDQVSQKSTYSQQPNRSQRWHENLHEDKPALHWLKIPPKGGKRVCHETDSGDMAICSAMEKLWNGMTMPIKIIHNNSKENTEGRFQCELHRSGYWFLIKSKAPVQYGMITEMHAWGCRTAQ